MKKILFVIPARGGSKGIPGKNIKLLGGVPLICRSISVARNIVSDADICVSTDNSDIIRVVEDFGLNIPFVRPDYLATDTSSSYDVLIHAINYYESIGKKYDWLVLLQPTSPFRKVSDIKQMVSMMSDELDMVVSVKKASTNPYYNCYSVNKDGFLQKFIQTDIKIQGRQTPFPNIYEKNGSVYVINIDSLKKHKINEFEKVLFFEMDDVYSVDLDEPLDWIIAEAILNSNIVTEG